MHADTAPEDFGELLVDKNAQSLQRNFQAEVLQMRELIRTKQSFVLLPQRHKWLTILDNVTSCCVLYVTVVTPLDITLRSSIEFNVTYSLNLVCNAVFFVDFLVKLNRAHRDKRSLGGRWVKDRRKILLRYLRGWMLVDILSFLPFDLPFALGLVEETAFATVLQLLGLIKLLRILKLISALPLLLNVLIQRFNWSNAATELLRFGLLLLLLIHYLACLWVYVGFNWTPTEGLSSEDEMPWIDAYGMRHYTVFRLYAVATYVSIVAIFGGVSSVYPQNYGEYVALTIMMFVGGMVTPSPIELRPLAFCHIRGNGDLSY